MILHTQKEGKTKKEKRGWGMGDGRLKLNCGEKRE